MKYLGYEINTAHEASDFLSALINSGELESILTKPDMSFTHVNALAWIDVRTVLSSPSKFPNLTKVFSKMTIPDQAELEAVYKKDGTAAAGNMVRRTLQKHCVVQAGVPVAFYFRLEDKDKSWHLDLLSFPFLHKPKREEDALDSVL